MRFPTGGSTATLETAPLADGGPQDVPLRQSDGISGDGALVCKADPAVGNAGGLEATRHHQSVAYSKLSPWVFIVWNDQGCAHAWPLQQLPPIPVKTTFRV